MYPASAFAALVAGLLAGSCAPALAQCAFDQSVPNANDVLGEVEPAVTIDFTDEFELHEVRVLGPDNAEWPTDWARPAGQVRQTAFRVTQPLPPGRYMVIWNGYLRRHHHADGGSIPFTVAAAGAAPTSPPAAAPQEGGVHRVGPGSPYRALLGGAAPQPGR
ncbi:copper resistance protein CopC [Xanthobacter autotrophicus]|uniref:copper resistance CopC family protein n=1 Tax=Xanthobacter autotrophicus TaxID=280 RepID=UPI003728040C